MKRSQNEKKASDDVTGLAFKSEKVSDPYGVDHFESVQINWCVIATVIIVSVTIICDMFL